MMKGKREETQVLILDVIDDVADQTNSESISGDEAEDVGGCFSLIIFNTSLGPKIKCPHCFRSIYAIKLKLIQTIFS